MILLLLGVLATCRWILGYSESQLPIAAGAVCWTAGIFGLLLARFAERFDESGLGSVMVGMVVRTGFPLLAILLVYAKWGKPITLDLARYLLVFYPVMLLTATWLSVVRPESGWFWKGNLSG